MDQPVRVREQVAERVEVGRVGAERVGERVGPLALDVEDREPPGAQREDRLADGGPRPAGAEQHDVVGARVRQAALERLAEAAGVGVVADVAPVLEHDGVDRAERLRLGRERVELGHDELLAGMGDVEAAQAVRARLAHERADVGRRPLELVEVEQAVLVVDAEQRRLALVERRAQRHADPGADQADDQFLPLVG